MDAAAALADLTEISTHVEAAVVLADGGDVLASTLPQPQADAFGRIASELLAVGRSARKAPGAASVARLEAATRAGNVFVVTDGTRTIAATTAPSPPTGLVFYDLETVLRTLAAAAQEQATAAEGGDAA